MNCLPLERYSALFEQYGGTDRSYLAAQYMRFCSTKTIFESTWRGGRRLLDIGAHWLHQSLMYARDGYAVTAADFPSTLSVPCVQTLAQDNSITLIECSNLEHPTAFHHLPDESFDVILFSEIIEHLAFNPISMWREFYRLLAGGGVIILTTPNYYSIDGRFWSLRRLFLGLGGGISVDEIVNYPTYGHHWKEFSAAELVRYFELLSPDFVPRKVLHVDSSAPNGQHGLRKLLRPLARHVPVLKPNLHVEVELISKNIGIAVTPHW